jgi:uncharacterized protein YndB with AHSA1/START domain
MKIERAVTIDRPAEEVFAFVSEPRNDTRWCKKVVSVEQVAGDGPGPGSRYAVVHKPIPGRPARTMDYECLEWDPPRRIDWREDDGTDVIHVTYELAEVGSGTRVTQRDDAQVGAPRLLQPVFKAGIARDLAGQLRALKRVLEQ